MVAVPHAELQIVPVGANPVRLWGLTSLERVERMAAQLRAMVAPESSAERVVLVDLDFVFDAAWLQSIAASPGVVLTIAGTPALAHCLDHGSRSAVEAAMTADAQISEIPGLAIVAFEHATAQTSDELRKRERPFAGRLTLHNVRELERASYYSAYKGVTDLLTKYLWPEWALFLARVGSRLGLSPNVVTGIGTVFCALAALLFYQGWYWTGVGAALAFMVLDTVDGKLARCTLSSSKIGEILDHGLDLIHPPIWYWTWGAGLIHYDRPLDNETLAIVLGTIIACYIAQRLVEGAFIAWFGMHIHVWRQFDSWFRLITARRNPNMVILFVALLLQRPDLGLIAVALWTAVSLLVHLVQLLQALVRSARGKPVESWLG